MPPLNSMSTSEPELDDVLIKILSAEQAQMAKDLIDGGKSISAVARTFNVSRPTLYRALERFDADV